MEEFWRIIENFNWNGDYKRCAKELKQNYSKVAIEKLQKNVYSLMSDLDTRFGEEWSSGGDDCWSDVRAETIGRGEEFFNNITLEKLDNMALDQDYTESFIYIFN